jgi:hypothetical protein
MSQYAVNLMSVRLTEQRTGVTPCNAPFDDVCDDEDSTKDSGLEQEKEGEATHPHIILVALNFAHGVQWW